MGRIGLTLIGLMAALLASAQTGTITLLAVDPHGDPIADAEVWARGHVDSDRPWESNFAEFADRTDSRGQVVFLDVPMGTYEGYARRAERGFWFNFVYVRPDGPHGFAKLTLDTYQTLEGIVTDAYNEPLADVAISTGLIPVTTTGADGRFSIPHVWHGMGIHGFQFAKEGYGTEDALNEHTVFYTHAHVMLFPGTRARIRLMEPEDEPAVGQRVELYPNRAGPIFGFTDEQGIWLTPPLPSGRVIPVRVSERGQRKGWKVEANLAMDAAGTSELVVEVPHTDPPPPREKSAPARLPPRPPVDYAGLKETRPMMRGRVVNMEGAPEPGIRISLAHGRKGGAQTMTRSDGSFELPIAGTGTLGLSAQKLDYYWFAGESENAASEVRIVAGDPSGTDSRSPLDNIEMVIDYETRPVYMMRVVDEEGLSLDGWVSVHYRDSEASRSAKNGTFLFSEGDPDGTNILMIVVDGYQARVLAGGVDLKPGTPERVVLDRGPFPTTDEHEVYRLMARSEATRAEVRKLVRPARIHGAVGHAIERAALAPPPVLF